MNTKIKIQYLICEGFTFMLTFISGITFVLAIHNQSVFLYIYSLVALMVGSIFYLLATNYIREFKLHSFIKCLNLDKRKLMRTVKK